MSVHSDVVAGRGVGAMSTHCAEYGVYPNMALAVHEIDMIDKKRMTVLAASADVEVASRASGKAV